MPSSADRAKEALGDTLRGVLPESRATAFVAGTHTVRFEDNVVPTLSVGQLQILRSQLEAGDGSETKIDDLGRVRAHAPHSSAMAAFNTFGGWLGREPQLILDGMGGWERLEIEAKTQISFKGGRANLDVLLEGDGRVVGVECKLTEPLSKHGPTEWADVYRLPAMAGLLSPDWQAVMARSLDGTWRPRYLYLEQLVKHALALNSMYPQRERTLIYCYWEPTNADDIKECVAHRDELAALTDALGPCAEPAFRAITYAELLEEWAAVDNSWIRDHVAALRARYEIAI